MAQWAKNPLAMQAAQEMLVRFLGWEKSPGGSHGIPLQHSCLENLMDKGAQATGRATGGLQSKGSQKVKHDYVTHTHTRSTVIPMRITYYHYSITCELSLCNSKPKLAFQNVLTILTSLFS